MDGDPVHDQPADGLPVETTQDVAWLRRMSDRHDAAQRELIVRERQGAMLKAGLDLESGPGRYFERTYSGSYDVDTIKQTASEAGVPLKYAKPAEPEPERETRYDVLEGRRQIGL